MLSWHSLVVSRNSWPPVGSRRLLIKLFHANLDQWMDCYMESIATGNKLFKFFINISKKFSWEAIFQEDISWSFFSWWVHETFCDALERLFTKKFMRTEDSSIISQLRILQNLNDPKVEDILRRYIQVKSKGLKAHYGKTLQYWLTYIQMVSELQFFHFSLKVNNFELKIKCWEKLLPPCFKISKTNYSRYEKFYVEQMKNLEASHPSTTKRLRISFRWKETASALGRQLI